MSNHYVWLGSIALCQRYPWTRLHVDLLVLNELVYLGVKIDDD
jgi:hypothetical protein